MSKTILQDYVKGNRKRGIPKKNWLNDIFKYSNLPLQELLLYMHNIVINGKSYKTNCHVLPLLWE